MTAATDNRKFTGDGSNLSRDAYGSEFNGPAKGGQFLKTGCLAGQLYNDTNNPPFVYDYVADGTMRAIGFVTLGADLTGLADNSRPIRVIAETGMLVDKNSGGGNALTNANMWGPVYGVDNQTCSALASDSPGGQVIGILTGFDKATGNPIVSVDGPTAAALAPFVGKATPTSRQARAVVTANQASLTTLITADGVTFAAGDVMLLVGQTTASQNGPWIAAAGAWQRPSWFTTQFGALADSNFEISEGTSWAHSTWKLTTQGNIVVGTTSLAFYPRIVKGSQALSGGAATISNLYILTGATCALVDTTAAAAVKGVITPGQGTGSLALTGTTTDTILWTVFNW